ncbi:MAG: FKBP-type peptidyl-prolyl cis-trans isomerase [Deltaproteobacteria bacterium]|nr:FKBP-type peptidyl-prolyl cis-trans isomerase [Deltaproteobacteria bacterium]
MNPNRVIASVALSLVSFAACQGGAPAREEVNVVIPKPSAEASSSGAAYASTPTPPAKPADIPAPADVANPPADAVKEKSGLTSKVLTPGTGKERPRTFDSVKVHYTGWTKDGKMFDSSVARGAPAEFGVEEVIKGWTEGLQLMVEGEKRRFWIPGVLAYGDTPRMGAPAGDLTFDVELLAIQKGAEPPAVPTDLAKPPKDAKKTKSGLVYRHLTKGKGKAHPKETDRVSVHYSGWSKDGKMFDSSVTRGKPAVFPLNRVIKGWTEGVQLMVQGDKVRFWIPAELAYGDKPTRPGAPAGELVFDVELIEIQ